MNKTIKSVTTKIFSLTLIQTGMNEYTIVFERPGHRPLKYPTDDLKYALARFDDVLVKAEGN